MQRPFGVMCVHTVYISLGKAVDWATITTFVKIVYIFNAECYIKTAYKSQATILAAGYDDTEWYQTEWWF